MRTIAVSIVLVLAWVGSSQAQSHIPCSDPRTYAHPARRFENNSVIGVLCGKELERLSLENGMDEEACNALIVRTGALSNISGWNNPFCTLVFQFSDLSPTPHSRFACNGNGQRVQIWVWLREWTQGGERKKDEPRVSDPILDYEWGVGGYEPCPVNGHKMHSAGEGIRLITENALVSAFVVPQLKAAYKQTWDHLFAPNSQRPPLGWQCLAVP